MSRFFLIIVVALYALVECKYFSSQSANPAEQTSQSENPIYSSQDRIEIVHQNYGSKIRNSTNIRQHLVPVALISTIAKSVIYPPLKISVRRNAQLLMKNVGDTVRSRASTGEVATLTGGPANGKVFDFVTLIQAKDTYPNNTRVGGTEDGVGFPMQIPMLFYDRAYGSFENALNYEQGLIQIIFRVVVSGKIPNPLFEPYRSALAQISKPNSTAMISAYNAFEWLLSTLDTGYYVYSGSYRYASTTKQIPCAMDISLNFNKHPWLSYSQWETLENLLNSNYQPQAQPMPLYPLAERFFAQASSPVYYCYN